MVKDWIPISHDNYKQVQGPFYHGTKANLAIGDLLTTGFISHFEDGRILKHIYFSALMEPAVWGAELAMSLSGLEGRGYIYIVEPTGPFEDDPNPKPLRGFGRLSSGVRPRRSERSLLEVLTPLF